MNFLHKFTFTLGVMAAAATSAAAAPQNSILSLSDTISDPNIVFSNSCEVDVYKMRQNWYLQNFIALDANAENSSDVTPTDQEYKERLSAIPTAIEMPYNDIVRNAIELYTKRNRGAIANVLGLSYYYMPIFESALERYGLPDELKYLAIVESNLNPVAVSPMKATGIWQFMLPTARDMNLEVNSLVDERCDPYKSSDAAARYLKFLYDTFNDWSLAITAYNYGPANLTKALRNAGPNAKDFWDVYPYLTSNETKQYFPKFIGATYAMYYYDKHGIKPALVKRPLITDTIQVNKRVHFNQISEVLDISVDALRTLNPQYKVDVVPGNYHEYTLVLPYHQSLAYIMSEDSIIAHDSYKYMPRDEVAINSGNNSSVSGNYRTVERTVTHKVGKNETYASIAKRYGVKAETVKKANRNRKKLQRGQVLTFTVTERVPIPEEELEQNVPAEIEETPLATVDSIEELAPVPTEETPAESAEAVAEQPVVEETIVEEPVVEQPKAKETKKNKKESKKEKKEYYKVKQGDTFSKIARKYGTTVQKLQKLNPGINPSKIKPGQSVRVK